MVLYRHDKWTKMNYICTGISKNISNLTGLEFTVSGTKIHYAYKNHQALAGIYIRAFNMRGPCELDIGRKNITFWGVRGSLQ